MSDYLPIGQKFKINDRVNKKQNTGLSVKISSIAGTVIEVKEKLNTLGRTCYYYIVKWPDNRTSEHAQHILVENTPQKVN
tara:strand:+ start:1386 stop:1625 length:240 start_codon:yes stop_codon:yes gene_type:complete